MFSDSFINKEEYLDYQKDCYQKLVGLEMPEFRIRMEERTFADMDRNNSGQINWWQYQIPMCVRKLTARKKVTGYKKNYLSSFFFYLYLGFGTRRSSYSEVNVTIKNRILNTSFKYCLNMSIYCKHRPMVLYSSYGSLMVDKFIRLLREVLSIFTQKYCYLCPFDMVTDL